MYAITNGIISDTIAMVLNVNSLEQLLERVRDDCRLVDEG